MQISARFASGELQEFLKKSYFKFKTLILSSIGEVTVLEKMCNLINFRSFL